MNCIQSLFSGLAWVILGLVGGSLARTLSPLYGGLDLWELITVAERVRMI